MWNMYLKKATIWSLKSINQYDYENYKGMIAGSGYALLFRVFTDELNVNKILYTRVYDRKPKDKDCIEMIINNNLWFIGLDTLLTGDPRALENYQCSIEVKDYNLILKTIRSYYALDNIKESIPHVSKKIGVETPQQRIYKYGIDVYVTEGDHVKINSKKQIVLSKEAKEDIIYNSKTEDQLHALCDKYKIYPIKAMKEMRNRLVYQHKQQEG